MIVLANVLLILGLLFILAGVLGVLRLPDFYTRLHAMGKCDTLGVTLVLFALAILCWRLLGHGQSAFAIDLYRPGKSRCDACTRPRRDEIGPSALARPEAQINQVES